MMAYNLDDRLNEQVIIDPASGRGPLIDIDAYFTSALAEPVTVRNVGRTFVWQPVVEKSGDAEAVARCGKALRSHDGQGASVEYLTPTWHVADLDIHSASHNAAFPLGAYMASMAARPQRVNQHGEAILARLAVLREDARDDGAPFNEASADALVRYCDWLAADVQPAIFLLQNGNLRAIWQNRAKDQIGIQFFPNGDLQYVILRDRGGRTLKTMGVETAAAIRRHVASVRLTGLWFNGAR